ncbi:MAG: hypothetical protein AAF441_21350, partial [Pseudomonadota bacterium]
PALIKPASGGGGGPLGVPDTTVHAISSTDTNPSFGSVDVGTYSGNRLFLVCFQHVFSKFSGSAAWGSAVTLDGNAMTEETAARATASFGASNTSRCQWFALEDDASGTITVSVTLSDSSQSQIHVYIFEDGYDAGDPIGASQISEGGGNLTHTITTTQDGSTVLSGLCGLLYPGSPATGMTEVYDVQRESSAVSWSGYRTTTTAAGYASGGTISIGFSGGGCSSSIEVKAA